MNGCVIAREPRDRSNPITGVCKCEIATLPLVARNDDVTISSAFAIVLAPLATVVWWSDIAETIFQKVSIGFPSRCAYNPSPVRSQRAQGKRDRKEINPNAKLTGPRMSGYTAGGAVSGRPRCPQRKGPTGGWVERGRRGLITATGPAGCVTHPRRYFRIGVRSR